jgi:hypothetical protein
MEQEYAVQFFDGKVTSPENFSLLMKSNNPKWNRYKEEFMFIRLDGKPVIPERPDPKKEDEEIDRLMRELDELKKDLPDDDQPTLQEMLKESREYYTDTPMYDFGAGQMSNQQAMADFYGWKTVHRIREEIEKSYDLPSDVRKTGQISQKLWQELRDIRAGRKPRTESPKKRQVHQKGSSREQEAPAKELVAIPEPNKRQSKKIEITQRERQPGDDYFMTVERGIVRNGSYRKLFKGPSTVYEWIWANVVRSQWIDTNGYPIKEKYYDKGYLAYCSSYRKLAEDCGLHKNKVKEYIDNFKDAGIIRVEHLVPEGKKRGQSVFIIGTWYSGKDENGKRTVVERYFRSN